MEQKKLTLEEFNGYKNKLATMLTEAATFEKQNKNKEDFDEEKFVKEKVKERKVKKYHRQLFLRILIVLSVLELLAISEFIFARMNQTIPIVLFIVAPTVFAIIIVLLENSCLKTNLKKKKLEEKVWK